MPEHISELLKGEQYYVVVGGTRYTLASEDEPRYMRGHGGNPFLFKLKDTGEAIYSTNVWNNDRTDEPDTAEIMRYSDWNSVGVSKYGSLLEDSNAYVFSDKYHNTSN